MSVVSVSPIPSSSSGSSSESESGEEVDVRDWLKDYWSANKVHISEKLKTIINNVKSNEMGDLDKFYKSELHYNLESELLGRRNSIKDYDIKVHLFGSFQAHLMTNSDQLIDCYIIIKNLDGTDVSLEKKLEVLNRMGFGTRKCFETVFHGYVVEMKFYKKTQKLFITFESRAWPAVLSSRLLALYTFMCSSFEEFALIIRYWAEHMKLIERREERRTSGAIFDYTVLYIMQTYMGLPVIEESKVGCDLEEFLKKPIDVQVKALKGVFDEYSSHYKKLDPVILFTNFIIFYGCAFDYSTCIQIVPSEEVPKETYPTFRISDAFTPTRNLFSMRPMLEVHFKNLLLFGVLDFLRPNNREDYIQEIGHKTTVIFRSKVFFPYEFCRDPTLNEPPGFLIWKSNSFSMPRQECFICYGSHAERYCNFLTLMNFSNLKVECKMYDLLKGSMEKYYENERVTDEHLKVADTFIADIKAEILDKTGFEVEFTKFGSWINGFGIKTSDYDLCVSHMPEGDDIKLEGIDLLHILSLALEKKCTFEEIYTAEVPILKFKSKLKDRTVTGDISASNLLAFENSKLLKEYSLFDDRVGILGVVIKKWASAFSINDASHRTLSSYALIIMLIHYLQHTKPPVLPYLQDSKEFDLKEKLFDDKYSVQFAQPTEEFKSKFRKNKDSVSRLLGGFFGYFLNFDWREKVVQIRTPLVLFKHDKDWEKFAMAIEDPFKLEHNLSRSVTTEKRMVILKSMNLMQAELRKKNSVFHEKNFCFNSSAFKSINPFFQNRARANKRRNVKKAAENSKSN